MALLWPLDPGLQLFLWDTASMLSQVLQGLWFQSWMDHSEGSELSLRWAFPQTQRASGWGKAITVFHERAEPPIAARRVDMELRRGLQCFQRRRPETQVQREKDGRREKGKRRPEELR